MKLLIATNNVNKVKEFKALLEPSGFEIQSLKDFPEIIDIEETGSTFEENAFLKARTLAKKTDLPVLADDSGLTVDYLKGAPGVFSARYAGHDHDDLANNKKLLAAMKDVPFAKRNAQFRCVIAIVFPQGNEYSVEGILHGYIANTMEGENGFGYDPLFYLPDYGKTLAQLSASEKNRISHRSVALAKALDILQGQQS